MPPKKATAPASNVKLLVQPSRSQQLVWRLGLFLGLSATATLAGFVIWSGARLIIDPYSPNWLTTVFPSLGDPDQTPLKTLAEIKADLPPTLQAGEPVRWKAGTANSKEADLILPIFKEQLSCRGGARALTPTGGCSTIVELQIYRPQGASNHRTRFKLINQITVRGPKESFVTAPLIGTAAEVAGSDHAAALTTVRLLEQPLDSEQPWISLEGTRKAGTTRVRYGQLVHYAPRSGQLSPLLAWTSSAGKAPFFQPLDDLGPDELIIDQTVGLEPRLQAYQVVANRPPQLKEISLRRTVFKQPPPTSLYDKALQLANSGVWSHALQMMKSAKETLGKDWPAEAEAQLKLIGAHAQLTQAQADRTWSSQRQQLLADLIDGRWETALQQAETAPTTYGELLSLLKTNFSRLWPRINAHLKAHPQDEAAQMWGALLLTARQTPAAGKDWLDKQSQPKAALERWQALTESVEALTQFAQFPDAHTAIPISAPISASTAGAAPGTARYQQLFGNLSLVSSPRATPEQGWLFPDATVPRIAAGQTWYHIHIEGLYGDLGWLPISAADLSTHSTAAGSASSLWSRLGLTAQRQLQVMSPSQSSLSPLTVQGVRPQGQSLTLLASGPAGLPADALVITQAALQWLPLATSKPLASVLQTSPEMLEGLDQLAALLNIPPIPFSEQPAPSTDVSAGVPETNPALAQQLLANYPQLQVAQLDITGDGASEWVLTLPPPNASASPPQTVIFEPTGSLVYSDLNQAQRLSAVVVSDAPMPSALLVDQGGTYRLQLLNP